MAESGFGPGLADFKAYSLKLSAILSQVSTLGRVGSWAPRECLMLATGFPLPRQVHTPSFNHVHSVVMGGRLNPRGPIFVP